MSIGHTLIEPEVGRTRELEQGWTDGRIPERQRALVEAELEQMRAGKPPRVYTIAAEALRSARQQQPSLLEVGCASGYYSEVLARLTGVDPAYVGVDYSHALVSQAARCYPTTPFLVADGAQLPFPDRSFDVVLSGCVLLHMPEWQQGVREAARVARGHVILHRTPVMTHATTAWLKKKAYGVDVVELVFGEAELLALLQGCGLVVTRQWAVDGWSLAGLPEPVRVVTYLCSTGMARNIRGRTA